MACHRALPNLESLKQSLVRAVERFPQEVLHRADGERDGVQLRQPVLPGAERGELLRDLLPRARPHFHRTALPQPGHHRRGRPLSGLRPHHHPDAAPEGDRPV
ncbi:unnamed protein product [Nezara viridula]|uniref:Uncharacterized protein n=1 Tax=Nezara viridula TaxID=85310 RepID=A0A9P0E9J1_NEZVI|nr:unnamed protein product [Nezara viridula]